MIHQHIFSHTKRDANRCLKFTQLKKFWVFRRAGEKVQVEM